MKKLVLVVAMFMFVCGMSSSFGRLRVSINSSNITRLMNLPITSCWHASQIGRAHV